MKQTEYEDKMREMVFEYIAKPLVAILGMYLIGSVLDTFLNTANIFNYIFAAIGGIIAIGFYYKKLWKKHFSS